MRNKNSSNKLTIVLFAIYLIELIWILLFKLGVRFSYMENRTLNLIPFPELFYLKGKIDYGELIMNVFIFVPMGIYARVLLKRWNAGKIGTFLFLTSFIIEGLQYVFRIGAFDITDIITNTIGGLAGLLLYKLLEKLIKQPDRVQNLINVIAALGTGVIVLLLILLKTNHLGIRYQ